MKLRTPRAVRVIALVQALNVAGGLTMAPIGASAAETKPTAATAQKPAAKPAAKPTAKNTPAADAGYRVAPIPAWVVDPPAPSQTPAPRSGGAPAGSTSLPGLGNLPGLSGASAAAPVAANSAKARRDLLIDVQTQLGGKTPVTFMRMRRQALDATTLREVSQPEIVYNPLYQQLVLHQVAVIRDGQRLDRSAGLRVEMMRREQQLERQMLDGLRTALVMLSDVRVGDVVELSYSVEGQNPIFEGRFSELYQLAGDAPIDQLHLRVEAPINRVLSVRGLPGAPGGPEPKIERDESGGKQVLSLRREQVAAVVEEQGTPAWFKVYPALHISEYRDWAEVDRWAQTLFPAETPSGEIAQRIAEWKSRNLPDEQLVAEVLRFVQDEVRYFSVSLGESSHRPKAAAKTLAERLGDCKDKVQLLNTLLTGLGFEARPALVSMSRNRGVGNYLPSHDQFDHVISRVVIGGQPFFLDPTMNGQGLTLRNRGYFAYGQALVVGSGQGLQPVVPPSFAVDGVAFRQDWDLSDLKRAPQLRVAITARGLAAELWRGRVAALGLDRISEALSGTYVRQVPGLRPVGTPEMSDSRETNELTLRMGFETAKLGRYNNAALTLELPESEIAEMLSGPSDARRRTPFQLDQPRLVEEQLTVLGPVNYSFAAPAPQSVSDRHFSFTNRTEIEGKRLSFSSRYERKGDEVLPADLEGYRERILRGRQIAGHQLTMSLVDAKAILPAEYAAMEQRVARYDIGKRDSLLQMVVVSELLAKRASLLLEQVENTGPLAPQALGERAQARNLLGHFDLGLRDADAALALDAQNATALEARGVALFSLNRMADALETFDRLEALSSTGRGPTSWRGLTLYQLGRDEEAARALREVADATTGEQRDFALVWMSLAAERRQPGQGRAVLGEEIARSDDKQWSGQLLRFLAGRLDRDALLKAAKEKPELERLRLAEAYFFIAQQLALAGKDAEAKPWYERVVGTKAVPYREYTLARLALGTNTAAAPR